MSLITLTVPVVGLATYGVSSVSHGFAIGSLRGGTLFVYVQSLAAASRLTPRWELSPNGNLGTGGQYVQIRAFATAIKATGLSIMTLPAAPASWGRLRYTLAGTGHTIKFQAWLAMQGV